MSALHESTRKRRSAQPANQPNQPNRAPDEAPEEEDAGTPDILEREWPFPWQHTLLEALCVHPNFSAACRAARISIGRAKEVRLKDPEFAAACAEAQERAWDLREEEYDRRGMTGTPRERVTERYELKDGKEELVSREVKRDSIISTRALDRSLAANRPWKWSERRDLRVSGGDGGPLQHEIVSAMASGPRPPGRELEMLEIAIEQDPGLADKLRERVDQLRALLERADERRAALELEAGSVEEVK